LYIAAILCALASYFICVCHLYANALKAPEVEPAKKGDEEAPEAKKEA
jgi:hypothetical protein